MDHITYLKLCITWLIIFLILFSIKHKIKVPRLIYIIFISCFCPIFLLVFWVSLLLSYYSIPKDFQTLYFFSSITIFSFTLWWIITLFYNSIVIWIKVKEKLTLNLKNYIWLSILINSIFLIFFLPVRYWIEYLFYFIWIWITIILLLSFIFKNTLWFNKTEKFKKIAREKIEEEDLEVPSWEGLEYLRDLIKKIFNLRKK